MIDDFEKELVDPEQKYTNHRTNLSQLEKNALRILNHLDGVLVERTNDSIQINYNDLKGIIVLVTSEAFEIRLPTIEWAGGAYDPVQTSDLWKRIEFDGTNDDKIQKLLNLGLDEQKKHIFMCKYCREYSHESQMHDESCCHGCAERELGVVH